VTNKVSKSSSGGNSGSLASQYINMFISNTPRCCTCCHVCLLMLSATMAVASQRAYKTFQKTQSEKVLAVVGFIEYMQCIFKAYNNSSSAP
jgi:hypothetical protein